MVFIFRYSRGSIMNLIKDAQKIIAQRIDAELKSRGMSVRACADALFNISRGLQLMKVATV